MRRVDVNAWKLLPERVSECDKVSVSSLDEKCFVLQLELHFVDNIVADETMFERSVDYLNLIKPFILISNHVLQLFHQYLFVLEMIVG